MADIYKDNYPSMADLEALEEKGEFGDWGKSAWRESVCCVAPFKSDITQRVNYDDAWTCSKCGDLKSNWYVKFHGQVYGCTYHIDNHEGPCISESGAINVNVWDCIKTIQKSLTNDRFAPGWFKIDEEKPIDKVLKFKIKEI